MITGNLVTRLRYDSLQCRSNVRLFQMSLHTFGSSTDSFPCPNGNSGARVERRVSARRSPAHHSCIPQGYSPHLESRTNTRPCAMVVGRLEEGTRTGCIGGWRRTRGRPVNSQWEVARGQEAVCRRWVVHDLVRSGDMYIANGPNLHPPQRGPDRTEPEPQIMD